MAVADVTTSSPPSRARSTGRGRATNVLHVLLVLMLVSSIGHYTDNYLRFDQYPPGDDGFVTKSLVWQSWILFTALGAAGYALFRRGGRVLPALLLVGYAVSGLVSPLHYGEAPLSEFDALQHLFIVSDFLVAAALVGFAGWLAGHRAVTR